MVGKVLTTVVSTAVLFAVARADDRHAPLDALLQRYVDDDGRIAYRDIEHEILRRQFRAPRIHFALVCASTSCPKLRREAYRGDRLDAQLDAQARAFLDDPRRNRFGPGSDVALSSIFKWFGEDFAAAAGSVPACIRRYHTIPDDAHIGYLGYDWTVNAQPGQRPE